MPKARAMITFTQFAAVMEDLGSEMDNLALSSALATARSIGDEPQTSSDNEGGSNTGRSTIDKSLEVGQDVEKANTGNIVIAAAGAIEDTIVEFAKVDEDKYLHIRETTKVAVRCGPKPSIFVKGTKLDPIEYTFVNTFDLVKSMLDSILKWRTTGVSLFVDLEGRDLGSHTGDVRLMTIYHKLTRHTYLVGVSELGEAAFTTKSKDNVSLKDVLESRSIVKGFWDARNDAAGLYREFGVKLNGSGVVDVQLVICKATTFKYERNRPRIDEAIKLFCKMDSEISTKMTNTKEAGKRMWKPAMGGSFAVFAERPLSPLITAYCVNDTYFLDELLENGMARVSMADLDIVKNLCGQQLRETSRPRYRHSGRDKALNPFFIYIVDYEEDED